jgi:AraC-like DNA-binding protein
MYFFVERWTVMRRERGLQSVQQSEEGQRLVVACALSPVQNARLTDALRDRAALVSVASPEQLVNRLRTTVEPVDVVVVSAYASSGIDTARTVRTLVAERPHSAIVAYCQPGSRFSSDIRALASAGVHEFVFFGIDDSALAFRAVLDSARRQCAAEWVSHHLAAVIPAPLQPMVEAILTQPGDVVNLDVLANVLGVHRSTLFNRCERAGFLPPAELLAWTRLALVAYLLGTTGCTVETIAIELAYPSDTALRNGIKRYTGKRATEIRKQGGVQCVVSALRARLACRLVE